MVGCARGLKGYTSLEKQQQQRAKADAAGKTYQGLHLSRSSTTTHAMKMSIARAAFNKKFPQRQDYRVRKKYQEGRVSKQLAALHLEDHLKGE